VQRIPVGLRKDGNSLDAELFTRAISPRFAINTFLNIGWFHWQRAEVSAAGALARALEA